MKLKLDLHPIFSDSRSIEDSLQGIIDEAVEKRASEVEIIPGKGSGALKKSVLRFLDRPDIKAKYHRVEKDGDNWGRLFVHFRHDRAEPGEKPRAVSSAPPVPTPCACCNENILVLPPDEDAPPSDSGVRVACSYCGSPNRISFRRDRRGIVQTRAELDYSD